MTLFRTIDPNERNAKYTNFDLRFAWLPVIVDICDKGSYGKVIGNEIIWLEDYWVLKDLVTGQIIARRKF